MEAKEANTDPLSTNIYKDTCIEIFNIAEYIVFTAKVGFYSLMVFMIYLGLTQKLYKIYKM